MDPLYTQYTLEQAFPYYRERREKDEKDSPMNSIHELVRGRFTEDELLEDEALYSEVPYGGGPSGKNLNTFA